MGSESDDGQKRHGERSVKKVGSKIEEAGDRTRWRGKAVKAIGAGMMCIRPPSVTRKKSD